MPRQGDVQTNESARVITSVSKQKYGFWAAISVVVANMIGTGVFTSLGFQLAALDSGFVILLLWVASGIAAFCGAMSYAELGAALPRSGGEYAFLTRIYHPAAGFISGWVSATIGFAAPIALAAITFSAYAISVIAPDASDLVRKMSACTLVLVLAVIHASRRETSGALQIVFTAFKIIVIIAFCSMAALLIQEPQPINLLPQLGDAGLVGSGAFAVSLIYASYAYTGWNSATYLSGEIENVQKNLPRILGFGTLIVMGLYVALNATFLVAAPAEAMVGKVEIAFIAAQAIFGETGAKITGLIMASLLISTVSAMTISGPRVLQIIGEDFSSFRWLSHLGKTGLPANAIFFQSSIAVGFILTSSFESILVFAGFTVALNSFFTAAGVFVLRIREPELARPYRTPLFPLTTLTYLALTGWTLTYILISRTGEAVASLSLIILGFLLYIFARSKDSSRN